MSQYDGPERRNEQITEDRVQLLIQEAAAGHLHPGRTHQRGALIRHEQAHWAQYERMGAVKFYAAYLWYTLRYGYTNNPLEREARAAEIA